MSHATIADIHERLSGNGCNNADGCDCTGTPAENEIKELRRKLASMEFQEPDIDWFGWPGCPGLSDAGLCRCARQRDGSRSLKAVRVAACQHPRRRMR